MAEGMTPQVALRIGLAVRSLPDVEASQLVPVLVKALEMPLTEEKLTRLTVRQLTEAGDGLFSETPLPAIKQAMDCLWGKQAVEVSDEALPNPEPYSDGDMPDSIRIAIASNNGERLDGHFGSCARFLIYQVTASERRLVDIRSMAKSPSRSDDKNDYRAETLADCQLLYVVSIGGPAAAKVVKRDIHPIKLPNGGTAAEVLDELQRVLNGTTPPWLAKVMGKSAEERSHIEMEEDEA